jgi:hypothetical protein
MVTLTPVDGDPFAQSGAPAARAPTLTPVEGNPFEQPSPDAAAAQGAREAAATRVRGPVRPPTDRQPEPSWSDVRDVVTQTATGANEGLAHTALRAADAIPYFISKAAGGEGVHPFEGTFSKTFVEPIPPPETDAQQIGRAGGNMLGENLENIVPVAGLANSGVRSGVTLAEQAAPGIVGKIRGAGDAMLDWIARNPGKAFVSDNVGAAQAGAGGEYGREVAEDAGAGPGMQRVAEIAGQMGAPGAMGMYSKFGPGAMAAKAGTKVAKTVLGAVPEGVLPERLQPAGGTLPERNADRLAFSNNEGKYTANEGRPAEDLAVPPPKEPNFVQKQIDAGTEARTQKASDVVAKQFDDITSSPEAAANLAEAERLKKEIPGFEPGIAKATNDPALLNKQQNFEAEATGDELRQRQAATDASRGAIREHMDKTVPPAETPRRTPEQVGPLPPTETPQDVVAGANAARVQGANDKIEQQAAGVRQQIQQRSAELPDAERATSGAAFRDIHETAERASSDRTSELRKAIANPDTPIQVGDKTMTINEALDRRTAINQEQRKYASTVGTVEGADRMAQLSAERATLDKAIEGVNEPGMKEYRDYYRDEHVPKYQEGAGRDVIRYDRFGYDKNKVPDEKVLAQFGGSNNISAAKQFTATHGENPEAVQLMVDHQLGRLKATALDGEGALKPGAVDKFLANNRELLDALPPAVRDAVKAKNPDDLYGRLGQLEQRQRSVAGTKVAGLLGKNPEQHVDAALNDWQVMKGLRNSVRGDPQAEAALTRAVWDRAKGATGKDTLVDAEGLQKWIDGHRRSLAQVLTPQHLNTLETVIKASQVEARLPRPVGTYEKTKNAFSNAEGVAGTTFPSAAAAASALARGRSSPVYEVPRLLLNFYRGISEREANAIWKEALYNPKVASQIAVAAKGGVATPIQLKRLTNYMLTVGEHDETEAEKRLYVSPNRAK